MHSVALIHTHAGLAKYRKNIRQAQMLFRTEMRFRLARRCAVLEKSFERSAGVLVGMRMEKSTWEPERLLVGHAFSGRRGRHPPQMPTGTSALPDADVLVSAPGLCACGEPALQALGGGAAHPDRCRLTRK